MRQRVILIFLLFCLGCSQTKTVTRKENPLNGTWYPVRQEIGGNALPKLYYERQTLVIQDSAYTVNAESIDKGIVRINNDKMDIYGKEGVNKGKHFTGLYKLENSDLTVCYNLKGDVYPTQFDTQGKPLYFLSVFKKKIP